jgi:imidazole glycerol-phosphate synthase subunit HisH
MSAWPESAAGAGRRAAIVDFRLGNLFSVEQACTVAGLVPAVTSDRRVIAAADVVILPGVGAFGDAMDNLHANDLVAPLKDVAGGGRLLIGICLGFQLLMSESEEFGAHKGLGLIDGAVRRLAPSHPNAKVPQIGWNRINEPRPDAWMGTPLEGQRNGAYMYFVHSYCVVPADAALASATTTYGGTAYCSAISRGSIHAFQFHPERSGPAGLTVYGEIARLAAAPVPA